MDDGTNMAARNGGILNALLEIDVRQFLDGKDTSKSSDTVIIDLRHSFLRFSQLVLLGSPYFSSH